MVTGRRMIDVAHRGGNQVIFAVSEPVLGSCWSSCLKGRAERCHNRLSVKAYAP